MTHSQRKIIQLINSGNQLELIKEYCLEKGKDPRYIDILLRILEYMGGMYNLNLSTCYTTALDYYLDKYQLTLVFDNKMNFINVI